MWYGGGGPLSTLETFVKEQRQPSLERGNIVIIKSEKKNCGHWKLRIVTVLITGRDGVVRGGNLQAGKSYLKRPL